MGQQQLLLLILGIVIVGLAVVVGINAFGEGRMKAAGDAVTADVLRIASDAQAWALKPVQVGGGGGADALAALGVLGGMQTLGYPTVEESLGSYYDNPNGRFTFSPISLCGTEPTIPSGNAPIVYLLGASYEGDVESVGPEDINVAVCVGIAGTSADDIGTVVIYNTFLLGGGGDPPVEV